MCNIRTANEETSCPVRYLREMWSTWVLLPLHITFISWGFKISTQLQQALRENINVTRLCSVSLPVRLTKLDCKARWAKTLVQSAGTDFAQYLKKRRLQYTASWKCELKQLATTILAVAHHYEWSHHLGQPWTFTKLAYLQHCLDVAAKMFYLACRYLQVGRSMLEYGSHFETEEICISFRSWIACFFPAPASLFPTHSVRCRDCYYMQVTLCLRLRGHVLGSVKSEEVLSSATKTANDVSQVLTLS